MGKMFGTDGIRGVANKKLTPQLAFDIARYVGKYFSDVDHKPKALIGKDSRISGDMLASALTAGFNSMGIDVVNLGVVTTPAVAYLTKKSKAQVGVMISASHNPMEDNGIKFFSSTGHKLSDEVENEIEKQYFQSQKLPQKTGVQIGTLVNDDLLVKKIH